MTGINAPASADRVLRDLRLRNQLGYKLMSRRESLYEALWVDEPPPVQLVLDYSPKPPEPTASSRMEQDAQ